MLIIGLVSALVVYLSIGRFVHGINDRFAETDCPRVPAWIWAIFWPVALLIAGAVVCVIAVVVVLLLFPALLDWAYQKGRGH